MKMEAVKERDALFDNIKGVLIILVVLGHLLAGDGNENMNCFGITHYFIYAVHMPMFILLSGYFSKSEYNWKKFIKGCVIPYIILYSIFCILRYVNYLQMKIILSLFSYLRMDTGIFYLLE